MKNKILIKKFLVIKIIVVLIITSSFPYPLARLSAKTKTETIDGEKYYVLEDKSQNIGRCKIFIKLLSNKEQPDLDSKIKVIVGAYPCDLIKKKSKYKVVVTSKKGSLDLLGVYKIWEDKLKNTGIEKEIEKLEKEKNNLEKRKYKTAIVKKRINIINNKLKDLKNKLILQKPWKESKILVKKWRGIGNPVTRVVFNLKPNCKIIESKGDMKKIRCENKDGNYTLDQCKITGYEYKEELSSGLFEEESSSSLLGRSKRYYYTIEAEQTNKYYGSINGQGVLSLCRTYEGWINEKDNVPSLSAIYQFKYHDIFYNKSTYTDYTPIRFIYTFEPEYHGNQTFKAVHHIDYKVKKKSKRFGFIGGIIGAIVGAFTGWVWVGTLSGSFWGSRIGQISGMIIGNNIKSGGGKKRGWIEVSSPFFVNIKPTNVISREPSANSAKVQEINNSLKNSVKSALPEYVVGYPIQTKYSVSLIPGIFKKDSGGFWISIYKDNEEVDKSTTTPLQNTRADVKSAEFEFIPKTAGKHTLCTVHNADDESNNPPDEERACTTINVYRYICYSGFCYECSEEPKKVGAFVDLKSGNCKIVEPAKCKAFINSDCKSTGRE